MAAGARWPQAWDDALCAIWREGLTTALTADRMEETFPGSTFTKNMIISASHRLGLPKREKPEPGGRPPSDAGWQEPHIALTRKMWADGHTASKISRRLLAQFGFKVTKNAVVSKIHRSGMARAESGRVRAYETRALEVKVARGEIRRPAEPSQASNKPSPSRFFLPPRPTPPRIAAQCPPAPDCQPITILDLTSRTCHWPLERKEDGERLFCGGEVGKRDRRRRYCDHHHYRELERPRRTAA